MPASERDPRDWEFRLVGRVLFRIRRRVVYLIILGLSIGAGLHSPGAVLNFAEKALQKLLEELHGWRTIADSIVKRIAPAGKAKKNGASLPETLPAGGVGYAGIHKRMKFAAPNVDEPDDRMRPARRLMCYAHAEFLHGRALRLREAPCSSSPLLRTVEAGTRLRPTGRHARCVTYGVWRVWSEVIYRNETFWAARRYLLCHA